MTKMLMIDHSKCTGCRLCEVVCSANKTGSSNPTRSRIAVIKWEDACLEIPMVCQQCESAPCRAVCPVGALMRDEALSRLVVNYDSCIGCRFCVAACPFGAMGFDVVARRVAKCDLCDGDPTCVKFCETKALQYADTSLLNMSKKRQAAEGLAELLKMHLVKPRVP